MKKRTILILTLISIIAMVAGTAMTSNAPRSIRFLESRFVNGKGAVFLFETTGKFTQQEMKSAFAYGNSGDPLDVHCVVQAEKDRIACMVKDVNRYSSVLINIVGLGFWAEVPQPTLACLGFAVTHPEVEGKIAYIPFSWNFQGADTPAEVMALFEQNGWIIVDTCITDPGGLEIPKG